MGNAFMEFPMAAAHAADGSVVDRDALGNRPSIK
jgi:hypothetical protein